MKKVRCSKERIIGILKEATPLDIGRKAIGGSYLDNSKHLSTSAADPKPALD